MPQLQQEAILGTPFMEEQSVTMEFGRKCIYLGRQQRQTAYWQAQTDVLAPNTLPSELQIPSNAPDTLHSLLRDFADLFHNPTYQPTTLSTRHHISLTSDKRINLKPYPMSPAKKHLLYTQVDELLHKGIIEPSQSNYSSPPVIVERPGKKPRFCIDYRQLNAITADEPSVLPHIHENLRDLGEATVFTLLDLRSGYWQVPLSEESKPLTAFSTPDGALYQFTVMPFGLKGAPATFQRLMTHEVLVGYLHEFVKVYLDDILIYSKTAEEHVKHLAMVFERLRLHHLSISAEKCTFMTPQLDYLGHHISGDILTPQSKHLEDLRRYETPRTKRQLQGFLGTLNWIREYIPDVARHTQALTALLKKDRKFVWTPDAQQAFEYLKTEATKPLKLHRPDPTRPYILQTDGSLEGLGAVLYQETPTKERHVISYSSATLSATEKKYHVNEIETLAVVWAIKRYSTLLADRHFTLRTDSRCLLWLNKHQDMKTKLARWSLMLQEYSFSVEHCPGKHNQLPDFLSRHPQPESEANKPDLNDDKMFVPTVSNINAITSDELYRQVCEAQQRSRVIQREIGKYLDIRQFRPQNPEERRVLNEYTVENDLLFRKIGNRKLLVVPRRISKRVIRHHHDSPDQAHPGGDETVQQIARLYHWKRIRKDVKEYVKRCITCVAVKTRQPQERAPLRAHHSRGPFEMISVDVLGPYPETPTKNRFILIATDTFTKWVEARALPHAKARNLIKFIDEEITARYGRPASIISDNGRVFASNTFQRYLRRSQIRQLFTGVEHQRANPVERRVQELKKVLRTIMLRQPANKWDNFLGRTLFILRNRTNAATHHTPSEMLLGYPLPMPGHWDIPEYQRLRENPTRPDRNTIVARQLDYQNKYAQPQQQPPVRFQIGDRVMARKLGPGRMFEPAWTGPHTVVRIVTDVLYEIDREGAYVMYHVDSLRPAPDGNDSDEEARVASSDDESTDNESTDDDSTDDGSDAPTQNNETIDDARVGPDVSGRFAEAPPATDVASCQAGPSRPERPTAQQPAPTPELDTQESRQACAPDSGRIHARQPVNQPPRRRRRVRLIIRDAPTPPAPNEH